MARKWQRRGQALTFVELLAIGAIGVRRELSWPDTEEFGRSSNFVSAVELNDGRALVCRTEQGFAGSDVTPADPIEVAFYVFDAAGVKP